MRLLRLQVANLRNLVTADLGMLGSVNAIVGPNGSGKTSLLEAIYLLCNGRSFRHHLVRPLLREGAANSVVFGEFVKGESRFGLGVQKGREATLAKLNGERLSSMAELVRIAPTQVLHSDSFDLLFGPPGLRRSYMDWLLFHVEHGFLELWREAQRALRQRNALVRGGRIDPLQLGLWSRSYASLALQVDQARRTVLQRLVPEIEKLAAVLLPELAAGLDFGYQRGWHRDKSLDELLIDDWRQDVEQGYTRSGPHRADLRVRIDQRPAAELLSRGQAKLLIMSMKLAQVRLLMEEGVSCMVLVDDLPAELDKQSRSRLGEVLISLNQQVFVTAVDSADLPETLFAAGSARVFHVEHGLVRPCPPLLS
jgi:DNA replication and repair protein RecF